MTNVQSCRNIWIRKQNKMMAFKSVHQQTSYTCHIPHIEEVKVKPSPSHEGARVWYTYMYLISSFRGAKLLRVTDPPPTHPWNGHLSIAVLPAYTGTKFQLGGLRHFRFWTSDLPLMTTEQCVPPYWTTHRKSNFFFFFYQIWINWQLVLATNIRCLRKLGDLQISHHDPPWIFRRDF